MEVGGAKAARTDPQGPPGVPCHQEYVRWADATRLTPPCHKHDPNRASCANKCHEQLSTWSTLRELGRSQAPVGRGGIGSCENQSLARINRENSRYRLRPAWWSPEKSNGIVARARSLRVRQSSWHMMAPTRPSTIGTEVSTERWNSSALPWPVWVNLHRGSVVVSAAMWSVMS